LEAFDKATDLDPTLVDAHLILGEVYFRERNYKKAESHFAAVLKQESDNVPALSGIAEAKVHKGDIKDALAYLERAINASPRNVGLRLRLAGLYETETRDLEQALSVYKRIDALLGDRRVTEKVPF